MKIIKINAIYGQASTGKIIKQSMKLLNTNGFKVVAACYDGRPKSAYIKIGSLMDRKLHALLSRLTGKQAHYSKIATNRLINRINRIKPDIIELHNVHGNFINLNILLNYIAKKDIATVVVLHDCWFYTGKCTHYSADKCFYWKVHCKNCPRIKKDIPSWFFDRTHSMFQDKKNAFHKIPRLAVIGVSDWITNEAKQSYLSSAKIIKRIYNWVDLDVFKPELDFMLRENLNLKNKFVILGVASKWTNQKGLDKFINLSKEIGDDMKIVLVGRCEQSLPEKIIHIGEIHDEKKLASFYSMADVLINLSMEESFGMVSAEALACGTPVIVMDSTASPELVGEGCGYKAKPGDINEVKRYIKEIKDLGKKKYSKSCIEYAHSNFSFKERIKDYVEVYDRLSYMRKNQK